MFLEDYSAPIEAKGKTVKIYKNGDSTLFCTVKLTMQTKFSDIRKLLEQKLKANFTKLRLFNLEGVEIMEADLEFQKSGSTLYASQGEEFDANSTFSEYEITQELGEGGFGKVVLGIHRTTKQKVAIKIIKTQMIGNAQDIDMVFREAEVLKSLNHKNIVKILNSFTLSNMQVVFIMEYLEGGELLDYISEKGRLSEEEAKHFFKQLVSAMAYCHSLKMIHRDLKLENLLLTDKGSDQIKTIDFGIAGMASNFNADSADAGSLRYMAPEILTGQSKVTPLVDVWAMGIILYGMLFGTLPFQGNNNKDIIQQVSTGQFDLPNDVPISEDCLDCLKKLLEVDPNKRISSVDLQYHPWICEKNSMKEQYEEEKKVQSKETMPKQFFEQKQTQSAKKQTPNEKKNGSFTFTNNQPTQVKKTGTTSTKAGIGKLGGSKK